MKKSLSFITLATLFVGLLASCAKKTTAYQAKESLLNQSETTINIVGNSSSFKGIEQAASSFKTVYPNCTVNYEYVQNYTKSLITRLGNNDNVDLFISDNIQANSTTLPYAYNFLSDSNKVDLSNTYDGLIKNFLYAGTTNELYCIPFGGEIRGLFVNKTLLNSLGLSIPTNYSEFMNCSVTLLEKGYVPLQGNPGLMAPMFMYPYICNIVANAADYESVYNQINNCEPGVSELFREPMKRLYTIVEKGYYNYKYVETNLGNFKDGNQTTAIIDFLNIAYDSETKTYAKVEGIGDVAFLPETMSFKSQLDRWAADYQVNIDYEFILSPVGDDGGFAYLSPSNGIAVNKNSKNIDFSLEFVNYLFADSTNKAFATVQSIIPNTKDALTTITKTFDIPSNRISQLGQVSFDYVFYNVLKENLINVSKANAQKYMIDNQDGTYTMYSLDKYMADLEAAFQKAKPQN